ncbi:MAG TPA: acyl-CoA desaturase [Acidimicrobiales bacterium]|nr:acyl-CoA desaturase [Acidimicrobiales bacterium]
MTPEAIVANASIDAGVDGDVERGATNPATLDVATVREKTSLASRIITSIALIVPVFGLLSAARVLWGVDLHPLDLYLFAIFYFITGLGITVGYHRLFTHKAFRASQPVRAIFAILGAMTLQGPVTQWVTDHRKHHARSDAEGDPHSPNLAGPGYFHHVYGFFHSHVGWLISTKGMERGMLYGRDLFEDPMIRFIDRAYFAWVALSIGLPYLIAFAITGSNARGVEALVWAGLVRIFFFQHATFAVNSVCHTWGKRPFVTGDKSTNNVIVAVLTFGEGWHNNHHAFPRSARHGLNTAQLDVSYLVIRLLTKFRLASEVRLPTDQQLARITRTDARLS